MRPITKRIRRLEQKAGVVCVHCGAPLICGLCQQWPGERARWDFARLTEAEIEELERLITKGYGGVRWRGD
jgi:hypothetical protein